MKCRGFVCTYEHYAFLVSKQLWRYNNELWSKLVRHQNTGILFGIYKLSGPVVEPSLCLCATTQGLQVFKFCRTCISMSNYYLNIPARGKCNSIKKHFLQPQVDIIIISSMTLFTIIKLNLCIFSLNKYASIYFHYHTGCTYGHSSQWKC